MIANIEVNTKVIAIKIIEFKKKLNHFRCKCSNISAWKLLFIAD